MRTLYIDGQAGAAGDMILGALIDLGLDAAALRAILEPIVPAEFRLQVEPVKVHGIVATQLTVEVSEDVHHRHLPQVLALLDKGILTPKLKGRIAGVFQRLAEAEARIHGSTIDKVHFHEVGANDAVIDVVGSIWGIEQLGVEKVYSAPLVLGSGVGQSAHGAIQYPAPAVLEILRGSPVQNVDGLGETTTPTGAAILAEIAEFSTAVMIVPEQIGYGAGHRTLPDRPNLLRATLGASVDLFGSDELSLGTSDIDNTRPEIFEWLDERLRQQGAIDVVFSNVAMKKGRHGTRVEVLCDSSNRARIASIVLSETGSLGLRWVTVQRTKLRRHVDAVTTPWGPIRVKVASAPLGERAIPEYDDCRAAALKHNVPLLYIIETTTRLYSERPSADRTE